MKPDIKSREDIELLVDEFYKQVLTNKVIGSFFTDVVQLDWEKHIPVMYSFWETVLLQRATYSGNPIVKHVALNQKAKLEQKHFTEWIQLWNNTIDKYFSGSVATEAIKRADTMGKLMWYKIEKSADPNFLQ
jgi:hemoglobin